MTYSAGAVERTVRCGRWRLEPYGVPGLRDRRHRPPSPRRVPLGELPRVLRLYRERYQGFKGRHFPQLARPRSTA
jgi:hypothetical protein